ncbi:serum response factor a isoform X3 [Triplophysa dalaica]|uniref:serum response factor a isoform X3 n=1 Tax=Triplophysa dalaica TaxID=1582913 RepID=UPI0024DF72EB|nr:serum response factor a isoform X3 [Triplophysa dalaica]
MLGGNGASRGVGRSGNGAGMTSLQVGNVSTSGALGAVNSALNLPDGGRYDDRPSDHHTVLSGSDGDSDSGDDEEISLSDRRGVKRERSEMEVGVSSGSNAGVAAGYGGVSSGVAGAKPGKKTRGRVKIKMEFIDNKLRRYTTFSKRKTGIMKKAYELSTLTGTQVLLLVASETGHVYTFATRKLQPMITSETGKALIQTCLNSPDSPPRTDPSTDQRMSATGFEETDLTYQVSEADALTDPKEMIKPTYTASSIPGVTSSTTTSASSSPISSSVAMQTQSSATYWPLATGINAQNMSSANGTVLKATGSSPAGVMQLPSGFTLMPASHTATIVTSSVPSSVASHMMYPGAHAAVMYATSSPGLTDGSLTLLNTFQQPHTAMHMSHTQGQDSGAVQQMFLSGPQGTVQIPVSAVPMFINQSSTGNNAATTLTELRVVNLDNPKGD